MNEWKFTPSCLPLSASGSSLLECVTPVQRLDGEWVSFRLENTGSESVRISGVKVATFSALPLSAPLYGEGFQMLSQYFGTVNESKCITGLSDAKHYRIPQAPGVKTFYNMIQVELGPDDFLVIAYSSCHRFSGEIRIAADGSGELWLVTEDLELPPGKSWELEEFGFLRGPDLNDLTAMLADRLVTNHPTRDLQHIPTGWCSWYAFGPDVTDEIISENLSAIKTRDLPLEYVQIDDGYQDKMGDWFTPGPGFPDGLDPIIDKITQADLKPAIWLAPFIVEKDSRVLRDHPDWMIAGDDGQPLASDQVSFGGWRCGPWYVLDGTHPEVQQHLENMPKYFREKYGIDYFKLDANFWGTMHGGSFHDPNATRVEAYRRGMEAFNRGAGDASYVLGCNAPMWPSLGLVNGMRITNDIVRRWDPISTLAREQFHRQWQHNRLWINDPDCVCLHDPNAFTDQDAIRKMDRRPANAAEYHFHAAVILASGGMIVSGDDLRTIPEKMAELLGKLLPPGGQAADFSGFDYTGGRIALPGGGERRFCFNWSDEACERKLRVPDGFEALLFLPNPEAEVESGPGECRITLSPHNAVVIDLLPKDGDVH